MILLDYNKLKKYSKEFEKYNELLPLQLSYSVNNGKYIENLKKTNNYTDVHEEILKRRVHIQYLTDDELMEFEDNELVKWLKDNPQYSDVIVDGES